MRSVCVTRVVSGGWRIGVMVTKGGRGRQAGPRAKGKELASPTKPMGVLGLFSAEER